MPGIHLTEMSIQNVYIKKKKNTSNKKVSKQATQFTNSNGTEQRVLKRKSKNG